MNRRKIDHQSVPKSSSVGLLCWRRDEEVVVSNQQTATMTTKKTTPWIPYEASFYACYFCRYAALSQGCKNKFVKSKFIAKIFLQEG